MTEAMPISDERQTSFVSDLQKGITASAELLQTSVEDLKTASWKNLIRLRLPLPRRGEQSKLKQVYLICESRDRSLIRPIKEYLFKQTWK